MQLDLDAIEARAAARVRWCNEDDCAAAATAKCTNSECALESCSAHAVETSHHCDHGWRALTSVVAEADLAALVTETRSLRLEIEAERAVSESLRGDLRRLTDLLAKDHHAA